MYNLFAPNWITQEATIALCTGSQLGSDLCEGFMELTADLDVSVDNISRIKTYLTHFPSGAGYKNAIHYGQIIHSNRFQRYDYGQARNLQVYNSTQPPIYPLDEFKNVPIALFGGTLDELGSPTDVDWTYDQLKANGNVVFYGQYRLGHMSFAVAKDMTFFTVDAMNLFKKYATNVFSQEP